ncbi:phage major capsid protein [Sporomusa sphaeroides DSM 2875]|uniref:phage major capsid protein n=1 Tax=Sporomusa sphaeroides TaxID=47679 RepID=UPI00202FE8BC|nr:phage major capsid protein [Sporomusa sphaeroides]MCM0760672.1 phage major capsid protein [Sporomusa sphaeroides DSM 2875]
MKKTYKLNNFNLQFHAIDIRVLQQKHAKLCDDQQALIDKAVSEERGMTEEEKTNFNSLQKEIDGIAETIKAAEQVAARNKDMDKPDGKKFRAPSDMSVQEDRLDDGGFKSFGELVHCVKYGDSKGRMKDLSTSDAGILIPPAFSKNIMRVNPESEIVMPRAMVIPAGDQPDAPFTIPYMQQGDSGANGGVQLVWGAEGEVIPDVGNAAIKDMTLAAKEVYGLATVNNKTLENWKAAGSFIEMTMQQAFVSGRDMKFLKGNGQGCPLGIVNSPGALKVKRETTGKITYSDAVTMLSKLLPDAIAGAVFTANITCLPSIMTMKDEAGNYIFSHGDATKGVPPTLLGIPVLWNGKTATIGKTGDLMLTNFQYYLIKEGAGAHISISEHVKFTSHKTVFKIVASVDGQAWVKEPLLLEDKETKVSPYVILQ